MLSKLESVLMPLAEKIGKNKYLIAVRDGFLLSMPLLIVGSFFLLIANFPIPGWSDFWARFFGENWTSYFSKPTDATFTIMAILAVIGIWEKDQPKYFGIGGQKTEKIKVAEYVAIIKGNNPMQRLMVAGAGCKLALSIATNTTVLCCTAA